MPYSLHYKDNPFYLTLTSTHHVWHQFCTTQDTANAEPIVSILLPILITTNECDIIIQDMATINPADFTPNTSSLIINTFLLQLSHQETKEFQIYPRIISYTSKTNKAEHIRGQESDEGKAEYEACDRVQILKYFFSGKLTIIWLSGSLFRIGVAGCCSQLKTCIALLVKDPLFRPVYIHTKII